MEEEGNRERGEGKVWTAAGSLRRHLQHIYLSRGWMDGRTGKRRCGWFGLVGGWVFKWVEVEKLVGGLVSE